MPLKVKRDDQTAINLTPMIDIVFLLIIFFMVSSHFTNKNHVERDIAISVPQVSASGALTAAPRNRIIDIFSDGRVALDEKVVSINELEARLYRPNLEPAVGDPWIIQLADVLAGRFGIACSRSVGPCFDAMGAFASGLEMRCPIRRRSHSADGIRVRNKTDDRGSDAKYCRK